MEHKRKGRRGFRPKDLLEIANERINILLNQAEKMAYQKDTEHMARYVELAMAISRKYNVRIPPSAKRHICKKCHSYLVYGLNSEIRIRKGMIIIHCKTCGNVIRKPFK
jgi:ribonuclease P protein subunit RPR2